MQWLNDVDEALEWYGFVRCCEVLTGHFGMEMEDPCSVCSVR